MVELTDEEFQAISQAIRRFAVVEREDVIGVFMKTGAFHVLPGKALVALTGKIEECPEINPVPWALRIRRIIEAEVGKMSFHDVAGLICGEYEKAKMLPVEDHFEDPKMFEEVKGWIFVRNAALNSGHR